MITEIRLTAIFLYQHRKDDFWSGFVFGLAVVFSIGTPFWFVLSILSLMGRL